MSQPESRLQDDGTVFPPVTPDPPMPPGQEEVAAPELTPSAQPSESGSTKPD
ncbi:MAG: hypothetical protein ABIS35_08390 [Terracoccus sp.]